MGTSDSEMLYHICGRIAYPVKPPVGTVRLVFFRSFTILFTLLTLILTYLSLVLQPWKIESVGERALEFGVWQICKFDFDDPPIIQCFTKFYQDAEEDMWFQAFRYMMLTGAIIQLVNLIAMIALTTFKSDKYKKPWPIFSYGFLIAGALSFVALVLFDIEFEFAFAEDARVLMDWTEETDIEEKLGYVYILAWPTVGLVWINSYLCYYTKCIEDNYNERGIHFKLLENRQLRKDHNTGFLENGNENNNGHL
ncbi:uncharacterized protein [Clytia hemisphaerica]|uniref:Uncharacterized protein n=1 Tax=Clytia hemisphaerica TaxID=252671 RepID=A0A7M5WTS7_9CNID